MRSNYPAHEPEYRRRRAEGRPGWGTAEEIREITGLLARLLHEGKLRGGRLLELGCGAGDSTLWLAERGFDVHGVDLAPSAVAWAREKARERGLRAVFEVGDVRTLSRYPDGAFDLVLDGCCLHCIVGDDRARVLRSAARVLRPGGRLLGLTMCNDPVTAAMRRGFDPATRYQMHGEIAIRYCGLPEAILEEVRAAGFEIARWTIESHPEGAGEDMLLWIGIRTGA